MQTHLLVGNLPQQTLLQVLLLLLLLLDLGALDMLHGVAHLLLNQQAQHATIVKACLSSQSNPSMLLPLLRFGQAAAFSSVGLCALLVGKLTACNFLIL